MNRSQALLRPAPDRQEYPLWQFYWKPEKAWQAMYEECEHAQKEIAFEQYILQDDSLGRSFLSLFRQKAAACVSVRILCDTIGSLGLYFFGKIRQLRAGGVAVRFFNPMRLHWFKGRKFILPRDHTKLMIVDRRVAFTGGVCFDERMRGWRDTHIRLTGPVVEQMREAFEYRWEYRQEKRRSCPAIPPLDASENGFLYVTSHPPLGRNCIRLQLEEVIRQAKRYVYLTSPYFIPSRRLMRLLRKAADSGVDVRLLVSARSDIRFADYASSSYMGRLLKKGVRVFLYQPTVIHAKTAVADDRWATVGSMNLDHLSLLHNHEANVVISHPEVIAELKGRFLQDLSDASELTLAGWRARPLWKRLLGRVARIFKYVL